MWCYAAAIVAIAVIAEALGLGGVPAPAVEIENVLFIALILAFTAMALRKSVRR